MRIFRARSFILSPSKKSIARRALPSRPALKSRSGSGRPAPWEKVSFTFPLWALATAIIPSRDHTGLPIHFHSSMISGSASRMILRMPAKVSRRQSVSPAINWSICSDGVIVPTSLYPRQDLLQVCKEPLPPVLGALVGLLLVRPEARLLHAQVGPRARRGESPGNDTLETKGRPRVRQRLVRLDGHYLTVDGAPV